MHRGPKTMSLTTAGIYYTISPPLSGVMAGPLSGSSSCKCSIAEGAVFPRHNACSARCGGDKTAVVG